MKIRLDKYLSEMGCGTRSEVKKAVSSRTVTVNGDVETDSGRKIDSDVDEVTYKGERVTYVRYEYYMLNKPAGVVSATADRSCTTVVELIKERRRDDLFPVGRLDKDTEGLLLLTNDGELAHRLLSPKKHVDKVYFALVDGRVTEEDVDAFSVGIDIGDEKPTLPARLEIITAGERSSIRLTIQEGRFHQVKRMFEARGKRVTYLRREKMGTLSLDGSLEVGEYRRLTQEEVDRLC